MAGDNWVNKNSTTFEVEDERIAIGIPFAKVDVKNRTVEGFATLDNVDKTNEIIDFEASREAFKAWIGNIREMHGPIAVGKALSFDEKMLKDEETGEEYNGIYVKAYISKGAQGTWEKVLDGTLKGFSVGGRVLEKRPELVKTKGKYSSRQAMRITKYMLGELSVVDNPANPLALFVKEGKMQKSALIKFDGENIEATDVLTEDQKVFYCTGCDVAKLEDMSTPDFDCVTCNNKMDYIANSTLDLTSEELKKMITELQDEGDVDSIDANNAESSDSVAKAEEVTEEEIEVPKSETQEAEKNLPNNEINGIKIMEVLEELKNLVTKGTETPAEENNAEIQGGDSVEIANVLDVLKAAFEKVEEIIKTVTPLNNENNTDVTVADQVAKDSPNGSDKVLPQADGDGGNAQDTFDTPLGADNVTPKEPVTKAEGSTEETVEKADSTESTDDNAELIKSVLSQEVTKVSEAVTEVIGGLSKRLDEVVERVSSLESSGATKKSGELEGEGEQLKKSNTNNFWGGFFTPSEIAE